MNDLGGVYFVFAVRRLVIEILYGFFDGFGRVFRFFRGLVALWNFNFFGCISFV